MTEPLRAPPNTFGVTYARERKVMFIQRRVELLTPDEAVQLAAWLIYVAQSADPPATLRASALLAAIRD